MKSADIGEREMENQVEKPFASAPLASGLGDDDVEQLRLRRQHWHVPSAAQKAADVERTRRWHEKANGRELAEYAQRSAVFDANNRLLAAVGRPPIKVPAIGDPRDLDCSVLVTQTNLLARLIADQRDALNRCEEEEAEAQWQAALAAETPIVRWLVERLEAAHAQIAELLQAERSGRAREIARTAPVRPKAMSNMSIATGSGLCAEVSIPPSAARPDTSAARRTVSR